MWLPGWEKEFGGKWIRVCVCVCMCVCVCVWLSPFAVHLKLA